MNRVLTICLFAASIALIGCGTPEPTNVMENADRSSIEAYEAAVAADDAAMEADSGDVDAADTPAADAPAADAPAE